MLKKAGHKCTFEDERLKLRPVEFFSKITLRDEQEPPVELMLAKKQGVVRGPCSSGKTVMLLEAIARAKQPAMVVVWSKGHQQQWIAEIKNFFDIPHSMIGGAGGLFKKPKLGRINVCMQQSLYNPEIRDLFRESVGFVGGDEIQRYAARTFQETINDFPALYRIGVSADEKRKDGMESLIYDTFGKIIYQINDDTSIGSRKKSRIFMVPTKFDDEGDYEMSRNKTQLITAMTEDEERNRLILNCVKNKSLKRKKQTLILTERREHAVMLRFAFHEMGFKTGLLIGEQTKKAIIEAGWKKSWQDWLLGLDYNKEFERVKKLGEKRKLDVIVGTQKADVGISVRTLDHVHITTPTGGDIKRFNQQKGRVERDHDEALRKLFGNKATPLVFYYWDTRIEKIRDEGNNIIKNFGNVSILKPKKRSHRNGKKVKSKKAVN